MTKTPVLLSLFFVTSSLFCQQVARLQVTNHGVDAVSLLVEGERAENIFKWTVKWVEKNYPNIPVTKTNNSSIGFDGLLDRAFTASQRNVSYFFDNEYHLKIEIADRSATLKFQLGDVWWHPITRKANFSAADFFKKNGKVKALYAESKMQLEKSVEGIALSLQQYLEDQRRLNIPTRRQTDFEKGYVKNEMKYSVWQYYNSKKELELVINHTTGKVMYQVPDTSKFLVFKNGTWASSRLRVRPMPVVGFHNYYASLLEAVGRSGKLCQYESYSSVVVSFDVDSLGSTTNYRVLIGTEPTCDEVIVDNLKAVKTKWIPASIDKGWLTSRFTLTINFGDGKSGQKSATDNSIPNSTGTHLEELVVNHNAFYSSVDPTAPSEFAGGDLSAFSAWLSRNWLYPFYIKGTKDEYISAYDYYLKTRDTDALKPTLIYNKWLPLGNHSLEEPYRLNGQSRTIK